MWLQGWCGPPWCERHRGLGRIAARRSPAAQARPARCPRTCQALCLDGKRAGWARMERRLPPPARSPALPAFLSGHLKLKLCRQEGLRLSFLVHTRPS